MAHLTDTINDGRGFLSIPEKRRCLGAVRAMVDIARSNIGDALPQVGIPAPLEATANVLLLSRFLPVFKQQ